MLEAFSSKLVLPNGSGSQQLSVVSELTSVHVDQLTAYANEDPLVLANTSDSRRFGTREAYETWLAKNRRVYALVNGDEELLGLMWFGKEKMPDRHYSVDIDHDSYPFTTAQRLYGRARGQGLARLYIAASLANGLEEGVFGDPVKSGVWFETSHDNLAIHKSWGTFGFERVAERDERGKIIMAAGLTTVHNKLQAYSASLLSRAA